MAFVYKDRVRETSTTTGTGTLTLAGSVTGFQSFAAIGNGNTCAYVIEGVDATGAPSGEWETGIGTYTSSGTTMARTTVLASSNSGSVVTLSAGTKHVYVTPIASRIVGKQSIYIPAGAMVTRTTNGAAAGTVETSTNKNIISSMDFDTTTQQFVQFSIRMLKAWDLGTITADFTWSHAATTTNFGVVWALEAVALSDTDAGDAAFGTAQQIADTGGTTNTRYITGTTPAITIAGSPAAQDWVLFQVKRVPADAADTMAINARLEGVTLYINTVALTDD